jgi:hypothetical protein
VGIAKYAAESRLMQLISRSDTIALRNSKPSRVARRALHPVGRRLPRSVNLNDRVPIPYLYLHVSITARRFFAGRAHVLAAHVEDAGGRQSSVEKVGIVAGGGPARCVSASASAPAASAMQTNVIRMTTFLALRS